MVWRNPCSRRRPHSLCPFDEDVLEFLGVDEGKDAPEDVVGQHSVWEFDERLEPLDFGAAEGFDIAPVVGAGDDGADCDDVSELGASRRASFAGRRRWRGRRVFRGGRS